MNNEQKYKPPKRDAGDTAHALMRAGIGAIPYAGAAATELLNMIVAPSLEKRRNQWMEEVGKGLAILEDKMGVILGSLQENDGFIDTAIEATRIAIKTTNHRKREALKSAILNSALPNPPEASLQQLFLYLIDTMSIWHFRILDYLKRQVTYAERPEGNNPSVKDRLGDIVPDLGERPEIFDFIWNDLSSRALVTTQATQSSNLNIIKHRTTEFGELFLDFVTNPIDEES